MTLSYDSGPASEPFEAALYRQWMKLPFVDDDGLIDSLMRSARRTIEAYTGLVIFSQIWRLQLDAWPDDRKIPLRLRPFTQVLDATVTPASGLPVSVASALSYDSNSRALMVSATAPSPGIATGGIQLRLQFGAESADAIDPVLRHALFNLVTHYYFNRGDEVAATMPRGIRAELDLLKDRRLT